jgi:hypothetical protein
MVIKPTTSIHKLGYGARIITMAKYIQEQFTALVTMSLTDSVLQSWVPSFVMLRSLIRQWLITAGSIKWNKPT